MISELRLNCATQARVTHIAIRPTWVCYLLILLPVENKKIQFGFAHEYQTHLDCRQRMPEQLRLCTGGTQAKILINELL